jgi:DNA modification methylase
METQTVYDKRNYKVLNTEAAKKIATTWLKKHQLEKAIDFGLPEADDRYHHWRVPLLNKSTSDKIGELCIDAYTTLILERKSTRKGLLEARLLGRKTAKKKKKSTKGPYILSALRSTIALGDSESILQELPAKSIDLIFTSPPYYNARPDYSEYVSYEDYLLKLRKVIQQSHRVLSEGRFFVINVSPVLLRRSNRNESSKRIAVPFDIHRLFIKEGFDFIDDIIWMKPEGAGWATSRGRRFAADRNPLQYKAVPITEYILVYRKHTDKLIDWNIRNHPDQKLIEESKISGNYDATNVWRIKPAHTKKHPAIFPDELVERVIRYYSFKNDVVLDPFAGIGTVGRVAVKLERRFVLIEISGEYINVMRQEVHKWLGEASRDVFYINCEPDYNKPQSLF